MKIPVANLNKITDQGVYDGEKLNKNILKQYGIFVLFGAIPKDVAKSFKKEYDEYKIGCF